MNSVHPNNENVGATSQSREWNSRLPSYFRGREDWAIKFRFDRLFKRGNQVLVAHLVPADQDSERELEAVIKDRQSLTARFRERFGIEAITNYSPHISLGYFANAQYA